MTHMIQVCSNFHRTRVLIVNTRPDEVPSMKFLPGSVKEAYGGLVSVEREELPTVDYDPFIKRTCIGP